ncbi:MAG TPA: peptide chain release factor 2 [Patescibacteria group bacterium]|nr:peptide chain release factor 2 [Patescibacteria group bacterium]
MQDILRQLKKLEADIKKALDQLGASQLNQEIVVLEKTTNKSDFWNDHAKALEITRQLAKLKARLDPWQKLQAECDEALELASLNDETLIKDLDNQYTKLVKTFTELNKNLLYRGQYDDYDVIISIYAGAGGTDAQDWAEILMRMYLRWAEAQKSMAVKIIDESKGEEAGIKSVTFEIDGPLVYGKLQGEQGVHRLVRLSPYNADNLRQTSFAKVEVMPKIDKPNEIELDEKDLKIDVYRAGGHGGQSVNTTDSAVRATHIPTGINVAIQNERSQLQNKEMALTILRSKLAQLQMEQHKEKINELKGPNEQAAWGNQIRNYVLHPYNMVKDLRTGCETSNTGAVLSGKIDDFIKAYLDWHAR